MQDIIGYVLIERRTGCAQSMLYKSEGAAKSARTNMYGGYQSSDYDLHPADRVDVKRRRAEAKADIVPVGRIREG